MCVFLLTRQTGLYIIGAFKPTRAFIGPAPTRQTANPELGRNKVMYTRQIAAATALYAILAMFGALDRIPAFDAVAAPAPAPAPAPAQKYVLETEILHLREENIIP